MDIEGADFAVEDFLDCLTPQMPRLARLDRVQKEELALARYTLFAIRQSTPGSECAALIFARCCDLRRLLE